MRFIRYRSLIKGVLGNLCVFHILCFSLEHYESISLSAVQEAGLCNLIIFADNVKSCLSVITCILTGFNKENFLVYLRKIVFVTEGSNVFEENIN